LKPAKKVRTEKEPAVINRNAKIETKIEQILAAEEGLIPASGFLASVMERVQQEAAAPPPIPFPWKRAIPGILLAIGVFVWSAVEMIHLGLPALRSLPLTPQHLPAALLPPVESAGWVALALGASLASWLLSRHLVGRGGLL
jgi:hypothetical protein